MTAFIKRSKPYLIGVAGGSGSGKTYFSTALRQRLGTETCEIVYQDNFYIDQSHRFDHDGGCVNFDHPDAIDFDLLAQCLLKLKNGEATHIPIYDFATHTRKKETLAVAAKPVILVDGILIFHPEQVRCLFDDLIFFDTPEDLRFSRRLHRDVKERGRKPEGVHQQFYKQVKPMHDQFVEPSKRFAKTVVAEQGQFEDVLSLYVNRITSARF